MQKRRDTFSNRKLYILEVKSWRGIIKSDIDGSWYQEFDDGSLVRLGNIVSLFFCLGTCLLKSIAMIYVLLTVLMPKISIGRTSWVF